MLKSLSKLFKKKSKKTGVPDDVETISTPPFLSDEDETEEEGESSQTSRVVSEIVLVQIVALVDCRHFRSFTVEVDQKRRLHVDIERPGISSKLPPPPVDSVYFTDLNKAPVVEITGSSQPDHVRFNFFDSASLLTATCSLSTSSASCASALQVLPVGATGVLVVRVTTDATLRPLSCPEAVLLSTSLHLFASDQVSLTADSLVLEQLAWMPLAGSGGLVARLREFPTLRERLDVLATQPALKASVRARIIRAIAQSGETLTLADALTVERLILGAGDETNALRELLDTRETAMRWNLARLVCLQMASDRPAQERVLKHLAGSQPREPSQVAASSIRVYADFQDAISRELLSETIANPGMSAALARLSAEPLVVCSGKPHAAGEKRMHKFLRQTVALANFTCIYPSAGEASTIPELFVPSDMHRSLLYPSETAIYVGTDVALAKRLFDERRLHVAFITAADKSLPVPDGDKFVCITSAVDLATQAVTRGLLTVEQLQEVVAASRRDLLRARRRILARDDFHEQTRKLEEFDRQVKSDVDQATTMFGLELTGSSSRPSEKSDLEIRRVDVHTALAFSAPQSLEETRVPSESDEIAEIRNFSFLADDFH